jgi:hypothetical protein
MKSNPIFSLICAVFTLVLLGMGSAFAQLPGIPYQAYIMDKNGNFAIGGELTNIPLSNSQVMLQFDIHNAADVSEYTEIISVTTDAYGLLSTTIGAGLGTVTYGSFSGITWNGTKKTLYAKVDFTNTGNSFEDHGKLELHYMPAPSKIVTQGLSTGTGAPTATNPANPQAGNIYVDEATGNIYSHDGTSWVDSSASNSTGTGVPTATNPANPEAGDIYVDETTGDIYTYDGSDWVSQSEIVSADTGNIIKEDTKGLAFLDKDTLAGTLGLSSGTGAPTATSPADPEAGDIYVDEATGIAYTYMDSDQDGEGDTWTSQANDAGSTFMVTNTSSDITIDTTHDILWIDASAADINVTLPSAASVVGRAYTVVKADDSNNNLVFSESITGPAFTFTQVNVPGSYRLQSNGTNWLLLK